ncbi:hypothetical protein [Snodgrassella sp. CFCC 13594]|uniref:hypothetical protein n=1 Tax=Snodgrassella sp. CFCC 13594 TaxID=1775559 RepID=UPI00082EDF10|nr:hypothetical protein [Snodgrassella sp. CFCC 13594]
MQAQNQHKLSFVINNHHLLPFRHKLKYGLATTITWTVWILTCLLFFGVGSADQSTVSMPIQPWYWPTLTKLVVLALVVQLVIAMQWALLSARSAPKVKQLPRQPSVRGC